MSVRALPIVAHAVRRAGARSVLLWVALGGTCVLFLAWLFAVGGCAGTAALARWLLPVVLLAAVGRAVVFFSDELRGDPARRLRSALLLLALAVRAIGIDHEAFERGYQDEGTYHHHATRINQGEWVRASFVYPHLTYYAGAFALWLFDRWPEAGPRLVARVWGEHERVAQEWVVLRALVAALSALTVLPVWGIAVRLGGLLPAVVAALLYVCSPLVIDGAHLIIADSPAACLATFGLYFAARLLGADQRRDWLLGGLFVGLAAAAKYPAGLAASALVLVAVRHALAVRRLPAGLLLAGAAALGAFVMVQPSLLVLPPAHSVLGPRGMVFGVRQYSGAGWAGVVQPSNLLWYGERLGSSFGPAALLVGCAGLVLQRPPGRSRAALLAGFPVAYFVLLCLLRVAVERNLLPIVPVLCALLGAGVVAAAGRARRQRAGRWWAAVLVAAALSPPAVWSVARSVAYARESTRDLARRWAFAHLPSGTRLLVEAQAPRLDGGPFSVRRERFIGRLPPEETALGDWDLVILSANAYGRFFDHALAPDEHQREIERRYRTMLDQWPRRWEIEPGWLRRGPHLVVLAVPSSSEPRHSL